MERAKYKTIKKLSLKDWNLLGSNGEMIVEDISTHPTRNYKRFLLITASLYVLTLTIYTLARMGGVL